MGTVLSGFVLDRVSLYMPEDKSRRLLATLASIAMLLSFMLSTSFPVSFYYFILFEVFQSYYFLFAFLCGFFTNASLNLWSLIMAVAGEKHIAGTCSAFISFVANCKLYNLLQYFVSVGPVLAGSPLANLIAVYGYSVFIPFFATQISIFIAIALMRIPVRMYNKSKEE